MSNGNGSNTICIGYGRLTRREMTVRTIIIACGFLSVASALLVIAWRGQSENQVKGDSIMAARFMVYVDGIGEWRWRLVAANNEIIADSGEGYRDKHGVVRGIQTVKVTAPQAITEFPEPVGAGVVEEPGTEAESDMPPEGEPQEPDEPDEAPAADRVRLMPDASQRARKLALVHGIDLRDVPFEGKKVTADDIGKYLITEAEEPEEAPSDADPTGDEEGEGDLEDLAGGKPSAFDERPFPPATRRAKQIVKEYSVDLRDVPHKGPKVTAKDAEAYVDALASEEEKAD